MESEAAIMAETTIRVYKMSKEFSKQTFGMDYVCEHLHTRIAGGAAIQKEEIGSFGPHSRAGNDDDDCQAVLCLACGELYSRGAVFSEHPVFREPALESSVFKGVLKK